VQFSYGDPSTDEPPDPPMVDNPGVGTTDAMGSGLVGYAVGTGHIAVVCDGGEWRMICTSATVASTTRADGPLGDYAVTVYADDGTTSTGTYTYTVSAYTEGGG
jgi:hypothetical protein